LRCWPAGWHGATRRPEPTRRRPLAAHRSATVRQGAGCRRSSASTARRRLERFAGNSARYRHWLGEFVGESAGFVAAIDALLASGAREAARQATHAFKGRVGMLGHDRAASPGDAPSSRRSAPARRVATLRAAARAKSIVDDVRPASGRRSPRRRPTLPTRRADAADRRRPRTGWAAPAVDRGAARSCSLPPTAAAPPPSKGLPRRTPGHPLVSRCSRRHLTAGPALSISKPPARWLADAS
jgi:HPt (histidine-containing phosphotransfer) domain-containing protein